MIGNWVSFKNIWKGRIKGVHKSGVIEFENNEGVFDDESLEPIKVTKELLYKLGATNFGDGVSLILNNRLINYAECRDVFVDAPSSLDLTGLHILQNIHFLHLRTELQYTP